MIHSRLCDRTASGLEQFSGFAITIVMLLTGVDVVGRIFGAPVPGTYEIVQFLGGLIAGFALPMSYRSKKQVRVELEMKWMPAWMRHLLESFTRLISVCIFTLLAYGLWILGNDQRDAGEVTPILSLPFFYVTYGMAVGILVVVFVLVWEEIEMWGSKDE